VSRRRPGVDDRIELNMSLPLDADGFLRRECPTCEREFKWRPAPEGEEGEEGVPAEDGGYYCPYCGVQAPLGSWWTKAQLELAQQTAAAEVLGPLLGDFTGQLEGMNRPGGFLQVKVDRPDFEEPEPEPLSESDDMVRADFPCHPSEPVKVQDDWGQPLYCLVCGSQQS